MHIIMLLVDGTYCIGGGLLRFILASGWGASLAKFEKLTGTFFLKKRG